MKLGFLVSTMFLAACHATVTTATGPEPAPPPPPPPHHVVTAPPPHEAPPPARPAPPPPAAPVWNSSGWTLLGSQTVNGRGEKSDTDTIRIGKAGGELDEVTMVVSDSDLEMQDINIVFGNGQQWSPKVQQFFKEGQRTRAIQLPGIRYIDHVVLTYRNVPGGGRAKVELWGRRTGKKK